MYKIFVLSIILSFSFYLSGAEKDASNTKQAGVCFRFDDNHTPKHWRRVAEIFNKYKKPFSASLTVGVMNKEFQKLVLELQEQGHEVMDHSPFHRLRLVKIAPWKTAADYAKLPGVDHINGKIVCLRYKIPKINPKKLRKAKLDGNKIAFLEKSDTRSVNYYKKNDVTVYIPSEKKAFRAFMKKGSNPIALMLKSIWDEDNVNLKPRTDDCYFMHSWQFRVAPEAHEILARESLEYFKRMGAKRPYTWIMPGGQIATVDANEVKAIYGDKFGYKSSACWNEKSQKTFNEPNDDGVRSFGMTWCDFDDEAKSLEWNKTRIADKIALRHVAFGRSHLSSKIGGWEGYKQRLDGLLKWCEEYNIPVRTQAEWAEVLYNTPQRTDINVFPPVKQDRDGNKRPDGYTLKQAKVVKDNGETCLEIDKAGPAFEIIRLGGLEKGENKLSFRLKGKPGSSLEAKITYRQSGRKYDMRRKTQTIKFDISKPGWQQITKTINVPNQAATCSVFVNAKPNGQEPILLKQPSLNP